MTYSPTFIINPPLISLPIAMRCILAPVNSHPHHPHCYFGRAALDYCHLYFDQLWRHHALVAVWWQGEHCVRVRRHHTLLPWRAMGEIEELVILLILGWYAQTFPLRESPVVLITSPKTSHRSNFLICCAYTRIESDDRVVERDDWEGDWKCS